MSGNNDRYWLELFLARVLKMREAQGNYFRNRNDTNLRASKAYESAVDQLGKELIRKGFNPGEITNVDQGKIF